MTKTMKLSIIGDGEIGKNILGDVFKFFPKILRKYYSDQKLEVLLLSRDTKRGEAIFWDDEIGINGYNPLPDFDNLQHQIQFKASQDSSDLFGSNVIIFTAGISAAKIGSSRREHALPFIYQMINKYAKDIKQYAPESSVLVITNPSDISAWIMQEATGFSPDKVLGFGCELDAERFRNALRRELSKIGIHPHKINADVIGGHSEKSMIVPENSIKIDGMLISDFKIENPELSTKIDLALENADKMMREQGFEMIRRGGRATNGPGVSVLRVTGALLFGFELRTTCSQVLTPERSFFGIDSGCITVPLLFNNGKVFIDPRYSIDRSQLESLKSVGESHQILLTNVKSMPNELVEDIERMLQVLKDQAALNKIKEQKLDNIFIITNNILMGLIKNIIEVKNLEDSHSKLEVKIKDLLPMPIDGQVSIIKNICSYFKFIEPNAEISFSEDKRSFSMPNNKVTKGILKSIGLNELGMQSKL